MFIHLNTLKKLVTVPRLTNICQQWTLTGGNLKQDQVQPVDGHQGKRQSKDELGRAHVLGSVLTYEMAE